MKLSKIKYLFVFVCLFCLIEKTGISALSVFSHVRVVLSDTESGKDTNNDSENKEAKQVELKEYWAINADNLFLPLLTHVSRVVFGTEPSAMHLNWCPPVPTPPPNYNV